MIGLDWIQCQMGIKTQLAQSFIRSSISIQNWQFLSHFFLILLALESWKYWKCLVKKLEDKYLMWIRDSKIKNNKEKEKKKKGIEQTMD